MKVHSFFDLDDAIRYARKAQKGVEAKRIRLPSGQIVKLDCRDGTPLSIFPGIETDAEEAAIFREGVFAKRYHNSPD